MKKKHFILLFLVVIWGMVAGGSKVSAQEFGTPNYFIKSGDTLKVRPGLILLANASYTMAQADARYMFKDSTNIAYRNVQNTFTDNNKFARIGINQSGISPIPYLAVAIAPGDSNLYGLNVVGTNNLTRSSQSQATDTSSISFGLTQWTKKPLILARSSDGTNVLSLDSAKKLTTGGDIQPGNDLILVNARYLVLGSNSSGTGGILARATADGTLAITNAGVSGFTNITFGAGNITAGAIRGTVDTDITAFYCRTPNGTLRYILVADDGTISTSTTAP